MTYNREIEILYHYAIGQQSENLIWKAPDIKEMSGPAK